MANDSPGINLLCPIRCSVQAKALKSILDNYNVLLELWADLLEHIKDTEITARIQDVATQIMKFDYFFGISLGLLILCHSTLQKAHICGRRLSCSIHDCYYLELPVQCCQF